jgi:hypothetical protein
VPTLRPYRDSWDLEEPIWPMPAIRTLLVALMVDTQCRLSPLTNPSAFDVESSCAEIQRYLRKTLDRYIGDVAGRCCPEGRDALRHVPRSVWSCSPATPTTLGIKVERDPRGGRRWTSVADHTTRPCAEQCPHASGPEPASTIVAAWMPSRGLVTSRCSRRGAPSLARRRRRRARSSGEGELSGSPAAERLVRVGAG